MAYLTRVMSEIVDEWVERAMGTNECFHTHSHTNLGKERNMNSIVESKGGDGSRESGPIENTKRFLGPTIQACL